MNNSVHVQREIVKGREAAAGDISGPFLATDCGHILMAMFGGDTVTGANPYTHTFRIAATTPTYTIEKNTGGLSAASTSEQFSNAVCSRVTLAGRVEEDEAFVTYQSSWLAKVPTKITPTTWTKSADKPIAAALATFTFGGGPLVDMLCDWQVTFERETGFVKGANTSLGISDVVATGFKVSGYVDLYFVDYTQYDDFVANTERVINILTAFDGTNSINVKISKGYLTSRDPEEGEQFVKQRFVIEGIYDSGTPLGAVTVELINAQMTAY
jgi:hypothetical protein